MTTYINADDGIVSGVAGLKYGADNSGSLVLQTNGTTAISISPSQDVNFTGTVNFTTASFVAPVVITGPTTDAALRITQTGTGNALLVEDAANPDSSPFVIDSSGNVGIGTLSPSAKLNVSGSFNVSSGISTLTGGSSFSGTGAPASGQSVEISYGAVASTGRVMSFDRTGGVESALQFRGSVQTFLTGGIERMRLDSLGLRIGTNFTSNDGGYTKSLYYSGGWKYSANVASLGFVIAADGTGLYFSTAPISGTVDAAATVTERMRIDSVGNVGIGNAAPAASFVVSKTSTALAGTANTYGVYVYPTASGATFIDAITGSTGNTDLTLRTYNNTSYNTLIGSSASGTVTVFQTGGTERMRIDSSGNLSVGATSGTGKINIAVGSGGGWYSAKTAALTENLFGSDSVGNAAIYTTGGTHAIVLYTSATERMRIDSAGNVKIGVVSAATALLDVETGQIAGVSSGLRVASNGNGGAGRGCAITIGAGGSTSSVSVAQIVGYQNVNAAVASSAVLAFNVAAITTGTMTERMRIDANGNVGIGNTDPSYRLDVTSGETVSGYAVRIRSNATATQARIQFTNSAASSENGYIAVSDSDNMIFATGSTERMRIDTNGKVLVALTTAYSDGTYGSPVLQWAAKSGQHAGAVCVVDATTSQANLLFKNPNGVVGAISTSGSATTYATSSDYRLKEDVVPMTGALARVASLKPVTYKWKADGSNGEGFIAHELQTVVPGAVTGQKDAVDADGNPSYQGIDTSFLVATLTAAIQELNAKVEALEAKLAAK